MKTYLHKIVAFINDEEGASAVEYGLLVGLIAAVLVAALTLLGGNIRDLFNAVAGKIPAATG
jgi:pilus assembly protein Flp/PilA